MAVAAALVAAVPAPATASPTPRLAGSTLVTLRGDDVYESSGLVDRGRLLYTVNDSGDDAVVYGVDSRTGETVTRTTYAGSVQDVEALAPGDAGTVWAGDIGDNRHDRDAVALYQVHPTGGHRPASPHLLRYPDGPHDAETLLVQPRTQRALVVSKSVLGGTVYAAPRRLGDGASPQRLRAVARVPGLVTDGTFLPDGRHVLLRTYTSASLYTFPGFRRLGTARLPHQPQGEGVSVSRTGRVLLSTEGTHARITQVRLPPSWTGGRSRRVAPVPASRDTSPAGAGGAPSRGLRDWAAIALVGLGLATVAWVTARNRP